MCVCIYILHHVWSQCSHVSRDPLTSMTWCQWVYYDRTILCPSERPFWQDGKWKNIFLSFRFQLKASMIEDYHQGNYCDILPWVWRRSTSRDLSAVDVLHLTATFWHELSIWMRWWTRCKPLKEQTLNYNSHPKTGRL